MIDKKNKSTIKKKTTTISKASTKAKPKVSVVITVYNMEDYLRKCLNSIINQTLHDIEIICIDDSSVKPVTFVGYDALQGK